MTGLRFSRNRPRVQAAFSLTIFLITSTLPAQMWGAFFPASGRLICPRRKHGVKLRRRCRRFFLDPRDPECGPDQLSPFLERLQSNILVAMDLEEVDEPGQLEKGLYSLVDMEQFHFAACLPDDAVTPG